MVKSWYRGNVNMTESILWLTVRLGLAETATFKRSTDSGHSLYFLFCIPAWIIEIFPFLYDRTKILMLLLSFTIFFFIKMDLVVYSWLRLFTSRAWSSSIALKWFGLLHKLCSFNKPQHIIDRFLSLPFKGLGGIPRYVNFKRI